MIFVLFKILLYKIIYVVNYKINASISSLWTSHRSKSLILNKQRLRYILEQFYSCVIIVIIKRYSKYFHTLNYLVSSTILSEPDAMFSLYEIIWFLQQQVWNSSATLLPLFIHSSFIFTIYIVLNQDKRWVNQAAIMSTNIHFWLLFVRV